MNDFILESQLFPRHQSAQAAQRPPAPPRPPRPPPPSEGVEWPQTEGQVEFETTTAAPASSGTVYTEGTAAPGSTDLATSYDLKSFMSISEYVFFFES